MSDAYDEFGNYIGPELAHSDASEEELNDDDDAWMDRAEAAANARDDDDDVASDRSASDMDDDSHARAITLAEDKKYYPTAAEVYGTETETLVETEDAQGLD